MTAIIILAAGASTRLGQPKQLLSYKEKNLLQYSVDTALAANAEAVLLVLGAGAESILQQVNTAGVEVCVNGNWQEGMAASVRLGISTLQQSYPQIEGAIIMLCDQPFVTPELLNQLLTTQEKSDKKIIASHYRNTAGVPVLFMQSLFPELMKLQGEEGAKKLLVRFRDEVETVSFPEGEMDVDTVEDYRSLTIQSN